MIKGNSAFWRLVLSIWILMLCATIIGIAAANAGTPADSTLFFYWTNPTFNDSSCIYDSVTTNDAPIHHFLGSDIRIAFTNGDTVWIPRHVGQASSPDSIPIKVYTGNMGTVDFFSTNEFGQSCRYQSYLFAIPLKEANPDTILVLPGTGLLGEYYSGSKNNSFFSLLATRIDTTVNFDWGTGSPMPGVPADSFCVRWTGYITIPTSGVWTQYVRSSEGCRLWIDNSPVIDQWIYSFAQTFDGTISLSAGSHSIKLEYFEDVNDASCVLSWSGPGQAKAVVPVSALSH